jgi:hypothetical protein
MRDASCTGGGSARAFKDRGVRAAMLAAATLSLAACATSTMAPRHGASIANAGQAYATAVQAVADLVVDKQIDWIADGAIKQRAPAAISPAQLGDNLDHDVASARHFVHQVAIFKAHAQRLADYFDALARLVDADAGQPFVDSGTQQAASGLAALGTALKDNGIAAQFVLTDDQRAAIGGLAGSVATAIHGEQVAAALRRDAALIDYQIGLENAALESLREAIASVDNLALNRLYREKVRGPYAQKAVQGARPELPADWRDNLATTIRDIQVEPQIAGAQSAAQKLRASWRAFLIGRGGFADAMTQATLLNDTVSQMRTLRGPGQ